MSETTKIETKKKVPVHLRLMAATYQMWPTGSEADREMDARVEEVLDAACALDNVDSLALCVEMAERHHCGEANVYAAAPELLAALDELSLVIGLTAIKHEGQRDVLQESFNKARTLIATVKGEKQ